MMISKSGNFSELNQLPEILILFGDEEFLQEELIKSIINNNLKTEEDKFNFDQFDGDLHDSDTIADACNSYPMMSENRLVVIKRFEKLFTGRQSKKNKNKLIEYIKNPSKTTKLVISLTAEKTSGIGKSWQRSKSAGEKKIKSVKYPFDLLLLDNEWIEFEKVYPNQLSNWAVQRIKKKYNKVIDHDAAELLIIQKNDDLRELDSEIDKIIEYTKSKNIISKEDVSEVIGVSKQYNVFELQDAIGAKNISRALKITDKILATSKEEILIITVLTNFFISIWKLKEINTQNDKFSIASTLKVNPYFVEKYQSAGNNYSNADIENALTKLTEADHKLKSTQINSKLLLQQLIVEIIR